MDTSTGFIVLIGNPFEGLDFKGPFRTFEDAEDYIEKYHSMRSCETWVAELKVASGYSTPIYDLRDASEAVQMDAIKDG